MVPHKKYLQSRVKQILLTDVLYLFVICKNVTNGFGWNLDNSKNEYDFKCENWQFHPVKNGKMFNCYPNYRVLYDESLLQAIKN